MSSFIKGRKLWRIITGEIVKPTKEDTETQPKFAERLEDWDSKNHMMITWFCNTSVTSLTGRLDDNHDGPAKAIWDFLKERYSTTGLAHQYQLLSNLHRLRQEPGQSINDFLSQVYCVWDQLALSEPTWSCTIDAQRFTNHRDQQRLILFLMALTPDFEPVRASLLHRSPLPTLEQAISELLSEETRLGTIKTPHQDTVLATLSSRKTQSVQQSDSCTYCHSRDHTLLHCPIRVCKHCHKPGPGHYQSDCPRNPNKSSYNSGSNWSKSGSSKSGHRYKPTSHTAAVAADATSSSTLDTSISPISVSDIEAIVKQVISSSGTPPPTALSATSGISSWFFDSACCNHMTSDDTIFSTKSSSSCIPAIHTADGSNEFDAGPISENSLTASPEEDVPSADLAPGSPHLEHIDSSPSSPAPDVTPPPHRFERNQNVIARIIS
ncbi:hypothetical protein Vadar_021523 [Vaccinium darrowii]|uniref:Uncharacterized protein n=1 Tax=Vaccinium darrowii TaxID=229202 RepID=A0ACB7ZLM2_9ERIC|nr:hypothetical protein Vadar_021523 [Vaccinium darrowii]